MREQYIEHPTTRQMEPPDCTGMRQRALAIGATGWTVCEDTKQGALIFYGPGVARRIHNFPNDWYELPDEALYALSWSR